MHTGENASNNRVVNPEWADVMEVDREEGASSSHQHYPATAQSKRRVFTLRIAVNTRTRRRGGRRGGRGEGRGGGGGGGKEICGVVIFEYE